MIWIADGAGNVYVTGILNNEGITIDDFSVSDYSGTDHIFLAIFGPDGECRKLKKFDHPNTTKKEVTLTMEEFVLSGGVIYITARKKIDFDFVTYESVPNTELLIIAYDVENAQTRSNFIEIENSFDSAYCTVLADDLGNVYLAEYIALDPRYDIESGNLIKLDRSLFEVWRKKIFVDSIVTGNRGHVLVLGNIDKCAEVDGHVLIGYGQYLAKINPEGVVEWAYRCEDFPLQGHGGASMPTSGNGR